MSRSHARNKNRHEGVRDGYLPSGEAGKKRMTTASPELLRTPTDLDTGATAALADRLNATLADSFALYLKTKNFHWHVSGPYFRDYHLLFDEQAAQILLSTDAIAERVRKTGNTTVRSIGDIARRQTLSDNDADLVDARDMLAELSADNLDLVASLQIGRASCRARGCQYV